MDHQDEHETSSLRHRRKKSAISNISCCFNSRGRSDSLVNFSSSSPCPSPSPSLRLSPLSWFKSSKSRSHELPDMKTTPKRSSRSSNIISRMGRHRRHSSADFSYDPLSYSLNFEEEIEDLPARNFASRLPVSPPRARKLEELAAKMEAMELRRKGGETTSSSVSREKVVAGELRNNNVFEVRIPRSKADRLPARNSEQVSPPVEGSRPERDILVEIC